MSCAVGDHWPYRWFGWWWEDGPEWALCPSIYDYLGATDPHGCSQKVIDYLRNAPLALVSLALRRPCILAGYPCIEAHRRADGETMGEVLLSDGFFLWPMGLPHYVQHHGLALPGVMLEQMERADFRVPVDRIRTELKPLAGHPWAKITGADWPDLMPPQVSPRRRSRKGGP